MNKIINWTLGSFFRTLGRILVYIIIGYILFNIFNISNIKIPNLFTILDVSAETTIKIYDTKFTSNNYIVVPAGSRIINISDDTIYGQYGNDEYPPQYYIGTFCTDSSNITNWQGTSMSSSGGSGSTFDNTLVQLNIYNTKYNCTFPNSTYNGHIIYIYGQIEPILNTSATTMYLMGRISYTQPSQASWSMLSWSFSNDPVSIDYSNDTVISQNQTIISQNSQIIQGQQNIINNNNTNTNSIINNQNQNKNDIINNQNSNSQAQIQNANENTDKTINSQKVCEYIDKNKVVGESGRYLDSSGNIISSANPFGITDYINIMNSEIELIEQAYAGTNSYMCFYNINKSLISCLGSSIYNQNNIEIPANANYVRFTIYILDNKPQFKICKNGNQAIGDALTDDTPPSNLDSLNNSAGWLPAGPVDSILNLPLSFLTNLNNNLSKSCQPVNLPLPYINKTLPLPCVNSLYSQINGLPDWINTIGLIASAFILFGYFINLYKYIDDTLTFRENNYIDNWSGV